MSVLHSITSDKLVRLIGTAHAPAIIDVRSAAAFTAHPHLIPSSCRRDASTVADWSSTVSHRGTVIVCEDGNTASHGVAAWLRHVGIAAESLDGGVEGWRSGTLPLVPAARLPQRDSQARTIWVTRSRPKVDRIACPWLIRRFVDPSAVILYVPASEVLAVAAQTDGAAFDIEGDGVFWSHRGDRCTFDVMIDELCLSGIEPLKHLATIVRGADTGTLDLVPEAAGLLAVSLGLSRMYADDHEQLAAGMTLYDALYRWCRDARDEAHNWTSHKAVKPGARA